MTLSAYQIALIGIGGTIIGSLFGAILAYRFQLSLAYRAIINSAGKDLRDAIFEELIFLSNRENTSGLYAAIDNALLTKHYPAMIRFRAILDGERKTCFEKAWQDYAGHKDVKFSMFDEPPFPMPSVADYRDRLEMPQEGTDEQEKTRQEIIGKLEHILSFAKPK